MNYSYVEIEVEDRVLTALGINSVADLVEYISARFPRWRSLQINRNPLWHTHTLETLMTTGG